MEHLLLKLILFLTNTENTVNKEKYMLGQDINNNKKVWVFGSRKGFYYDDNSRYMFEYVVANCPEIEAIWTTKSAAVYQILTQHCLPVAIFGSDECNHYMASADAAFISVIQMDVDKTKLSPNTKVIQLWHGTPIKQNNIACFNETYAMVSIASSLFLKEQSLGPHELFNFQLTGYPRNDFLLNNARPKFITPNIFKIIENNTLITYLPTYNESKDPNKKGDQRGRSYDIWSGLNFEIFEQFLIENDAFFLFKLHALQSPCSGLNQKNMERSSRVFLLDPNDPTCDIYEYLKYTDILITDYSSVYFDFLLLDRPVVFACFDLENYKKKRQFRFNYESVTPGPKAQSWVLVLKELDNILTCSQDRFAEERRRINRLFNHFQDADSCKRIANLTLNLSNHHDEFD